MPDQQTDNLPARLRPVVAIDGPAGAGKSTLASHLARHFGFLNLETGAMYRALALKAIEQDLSFDDEHALAALCGDTVIRLEPQSEGNRVILDGLDVTARVRDSDVTAAASRVSVHPEIRSWMVAQQRALGLNGGVVMEGRDIGTAVFPDAEVKIFLDAAPEVRGDRRFRQAVPQPGDRRPDNDQNVAPQKPSEEDQNAQRAILKELQERDYRDRHRAQSPLVPAPDAVILDSTSLTLDQVLNRAEEIVYTHLKKVQV